MATVKQPTALPTNKLTAAMVTASAAGIVKALVLHNYPDFADPAIWEPLPYLVGGIVGYFVKDRPNT